MLDWVQFSSVTQSCPTRWDSMDCRMPGFPVHHQLPELAQTHVHQVSDIIPPSHPLSSHHLILCHPLLLLPSIFPSIKVPSNESVLCIRWPKYWGCSFSTSPSNEYSGFHKGSPRILEWIAYHFSRQSSRPRNRTRVSGIAGGFFTN